MAETCLSSCFGFRGLGFRGLGFRVGKIEPFFVKVYGLGVRG